MTRKKNLQLLSTALLLLTACSAQLNPSTTPQLKSTPISEPADTLTICLGQEPSSLYWYAAATTAELDVMQAIYDGPVDTVSGQPAPVIIEYIPNLEDGTAFFSAVAVSSGDMVIDTNGKVVTLEKGISIFPSGCEDLACTKTWDGESALQMDTLTATFTIKTGVTWSDGQPVRASDSVFSFKVASDPITPSNKRLIERTLSYSALNSKSTQWTSIPGFYGSELADYFWPPLPEHAWGNLDAKQMLTDETTTRSPIGWGAYQIIEWEAGRYIRLKKNPNYFRADEGLPHFENLVFKIINPFGDTALSNLKFDRKTYQQFNFDVGEFEKEISENGCDLTTTTSAMRDQLPVLKILTDYFNAPGVKVFKSNVTSSELLIFNLAENDRVAGNPLGDLAVRKAITLCLDREKAVKDLSNGLYGLADRVIFQDKGQNLTINAGLYNPSAGAAILEETGWQDPDNDAGTPRIATGFDPLFDGKELGFIYLVEDNGDTRQATEIFKSSLSECGIGINIKAVPSEVYWNPADEDSIFQGNFDLAQLTWGSPISTPCQFFSDADMPTGANQFVGINFSRFSNEDFNSLCERLPLTRDDKDRQILIDVMETLINANLPVFPLYSYSKLMVANRDFCEAGLSPQYENELTAIEEFSISPDCRYTPPGMD